MCAMHESVLRQMAIYDFWTMETSAMRTDRKESIAAAELLDN
jgi:hypothetical protein